MPLTCPSCGCAITITERAGQEPVTEHALPLCRSALSYRRRQVLVVRPARPAPTRPTRLPRQPFGRRSEGRRP